MSMSLLKQSMAIVEEGLQDNKTKKQSHPTKSDKVGKRKKAPSKQEFFKNQSYFKSAAKKKTIEDIRKEIEEDSTRTEDNIRKLLKLTKHTANIRNADKILQRAHSSRYNLEKEDDKPEEPESLFTEQDFADFEKELAQTIF